MMGKYGKIDRKIRNRIGSENKELDLESASTFGFATPKKNTMIERTNSILSASKKTPISKALDRLTPNKTGRKSMSAPTTPTSASKHTPLKRLKLSGDCEKTPRTVRKRISRQIAKNVEPESDDNDSEESEEEDEENSSNEDVEEEKPLKMSTKRKIFAKPSATSIDNTDDYFERQSSSQVVTSDKTLEKLKTPRLSPEVLRQVLDGESLKYEKQIMEICKDHRSHFSKWFYLLNEDFNVVLYGFGSKRSLLNNFHTKMLNGKDCVVINGFFPSLTMKNVLTSIIIDIIEFKGNIGSSITEQAECILKAYSNDDEVIADDLYLVVHNIDGPMLRNDASQTILSNLAAHPRDGNYFTPKNRGFYCCESTKILLLILFWLFFFLKLIFRKSNNNIIMKCNFYF